MSAGNRLRVLPIDGETQLRAAGAHVPAEIGILEVLVQIAVAQLETELLRELPPEREEQLPGQIRSHSESPDVGESQYVPFVRERCPQTGPDDGIQPALTGANFPGSIWKQGRARGERQCQPRIELGVAGADQHVELGLLVQQLVVER